MSKFQWLYTTVIQLGLILLGVSCAEEQAETVFKNLPSRKTNITFSNRLHQNSEFNIIEYLYFYNGGGVATGDINNDGLIDIYFTANQEENRLYLNRGDFEFDDITAKAGVSGSGNWTTGVTMADVNGDGFLDLFVSGVGNYKNFDGRNQLFINNGDLTFSEKTAEYGLSFQGFSTHASFFDYDNDGDLDLYLINHSVHTTRSYGHSRLRFQSDPSAGDKLYKNDLIPGGKTRFEEVTSLAGIYNSQIAYGLGVGVSDLNKDGFMDIYVSNDFHENDYLYINQGNGTFSEELKGSVPHVSKFSMGNDIADINNDGLPDIITLDMLPKDEEVIKTTAGEDPYDIYQYKLGFGYHHQFTRNTLQLNRGIDSQGRLLFSDIAALAGIEASDWSWAPLLADFDNDGNKDLFIANGILTRPNDLDYINFISSDSAQRYYEYDAFISNMPSGEVPNLFYKNTGGLNFEDVSESWIGTKPGLSTGAAYADFDNDGDLDLVINNINQEATLYRNDTPARSASWLQVELKGEKANTSGIGAKVIVYAGKQMLYQEQVLSRGWQSSVSPILHIGIAGHTAIDSAYIIWPDRKFQVLTAVPANQRIVVRQSDATGIWSYSSPSSKSAQPLFSQGQRIPFVHQENDFNAFNTEKLIPHMVSTQGPSISTGDLNANGLEDFFVGGAAGQSGRIFFQDGSGNFVPQSQPALEADSTNEDTGSIFLDADGDGALDLLVVSGGQQLNGQHPALRPRLYLNNGSGMLQRSDGLPAVFVDGSCVKAADVDDDNDLDLFIGGRVVAGQYGIPAQSFLLINDGQGRFSDQSFRLSPSLRKGKLGMVTDAIWCDVNEDKRLDLVVVGEWMPITILVQNTGGDFVDHTKEYGMENTAGWWNSLIGHDFDQDGDMDLVVGNLGMNSRLRASARQPVTLYAGDMDRNGGMDHLLTYYNGGELHPFISRDQLVKQVPSFRRDFLKYSHFRNVNREQIIPSAEIDEYVVQRAYGFASVYLENQSGKFNVRPLPIEAQMFPIFDFETGDFNLDGHEDLLAVGNLHAVQPDLGRYDAGYGLMLTSDGIGNFMAISPEESGFVVKGEGRSIQAVTGPRGVTFYMVARNSDSLLVFKK